MSAPAPTYHRGIVKQVLTGDTVVIRGTPKGGPPPEKTLTLSNITAPKLERRATTTTSDKENSKDEPFGWECREFLRKKLIGENVFFTIDKAAASKTSTSTRDYGVIIVGKDPTSGENIVESLVSEGLVSVRANTNRPTPEQEKLLQLEKQAIADGKGKHGKDKDEHVRDIKWNITSMQQFVDRMGRKPIKAVVEHVRDGSTIRLFLLPDFYYITLMISGIRCPQPKVENAKDAVTPPPQPFGDEAKYFTEIRLLQQDVEVILESVNNANFVGSVIHPKGNIAEALLTEGFAHCVDWSMPFVSNGSDKLRAAERQAKEARKRRWREWTPNAATAALTGKEKEFTATVMEIINADALMAKLANGSMKKIFLASIRPPRLEEKTKEGEAKEPKPKNFRPLYDVPFMYEAREFLRKKLIGKKVNVTVDYIQTASDKFPEKTCCTVTIGNVNVAEAMVSKGLATVLRYRADDDQRSSHYDELLAAETKANKSGKGVHSKKDAGPKRVNEVAGANAKTYMESMKRKGRVRGVVEFVASGSRMRIHIESESCVVVFLLAGINCPRGARPAIGGQGTVESEPFGEEALTFTRERVLQRDVELKVDSMDKAGSLIGWLWVDDTNLSVMLVESGLASVHNMAEKTEFYQQLKRAEDSAKSRKEKIWANYVEEEKNADDEPVNVEEDKSHPPERKTDYFAAVITETAEDLRFYAQHKEQGPKLELLMDDLRQAFVTNPPLAGAFTPKKGELCAAQYVDGNWYRAKVEKVAKGGTNVEVLYVDYGNRESIPSAKCASLPSGFTASKPFAHEYSLACVKLPSDPEDKAAGTAAFRELIIDRLVYVNIEVRNPSGPPSASLALDSEGKEDVGKMLLEDGHLLVDNRKDRRLKKLLEEYRDAQDVAKKGHLNIWQYGDITEDDANEFGMTR